MAQYTFSLPLPTLFSEDNFIVSDCNSEAMQWINSWPKWNALLLYGPAGCGKSHLGNIWAMRAKAAIISAAMLGNNQPGKGKWLVEDIDKIGNERSLLHFYNAAKENGASLLLTSSCPAAQLPFKLPDLTSRLMALPSAHIDQPDDEVLAGTMRKQFIDRQMKVDDEVIAYIMPRIERSFKKVQDMVELLDKSGLAEHKNITIPFAKRILER